MTNIRYRCFHCQAPVPFGSNHTHRFPDTARDILQTIIEELEALGKADAELDELDVSADTYFRAKRWLAATNEKEPTEPERPTIR